MGSVGEEHCSPCYDAVADATSISRCVKMSVFCANFAQFRTNNRHTVPLPGISSVVIVVIFFSKREVLCFFDGRYYWAVVVCLHPFDYNLGCQRLLFAGRHDATSILCAYIVALPVELCGVVNSEEDLEYGFKWDSARIEHNFNDFSMTGCSRTHRLVSWIRVVSTRVGRKSRFNTVQSFEGTFSAPKTSST